MYTQEEGAIIHRRAGNRMLEYRIRTQHHNIISHRQRKKQVSSSHVMTFNVFVQIFDKNIFQVDMLKQINDTAPISLYLIHCSGTERFEN